MAPFLSKMHLKTTTCLILASAAAVLCSRGAVAVRWKKSLRKAASTSSLADLIAADREFQKQFTKIQWAAEADQSTAVDSFGGEVPDGLGIFPHRVPANFPFRAELVDETGAPRGDKVVELRIPLKGDSIIVMPITAASFMAGKDTTTAEEVNKLENSESGPAVEVVFDKKKKTFSFKNSGKKAFIGGDVGYCILHMGYSSSFELYTSYAPDFTLYRMEDCMHKMKVHKEKEHRDARLVATLVPSDSVEWKEKKSFWKSKRGFYAGDKMLKIRSGIQKTAPVMESSARSLIGKTII